ncbi:MAG: SPOR domain-containing protein, partial [Deinococcus sp.]|nr:SPOR domain-containing protein [Deinococcus sp.]
GRPEPGALGFELQVGAFRSRENAQALADQLSRANFTTVLRPRGNLTLVLVVGLPDREQAEAAVRRLAEQFGLQALVQAAQG